MQQPPQDHLERTKGHHLMPQLVNDEIILDTIDKGLNLLGENPKQALWYCLEKDFQFDRHKVPENLESFEETLKGFFGLGYNFLEAHFRQQLQKATAEDLQGYKTFADCIHGLRKKAENVKEQTIGPELRSEPYADNKKLEV
jgi:hypothetical protein